MSNQFLLYINDFLDDDICNITIYAKDTTVYSKCDQASDVRQQLELDSELRSDLLDTVDSGKKRFVDLNDRRNKIDLFDQFNNSATICVKIDRSVIKGKSSFKLLGVSFFIRLG